ncbi:MAG: hypothetical protein JO206_03410 [Solirubrobacterales bacterium]|nr:hypothetical protein [Solirubrobacterales bacterium]MBV9471991.1 hypothetical protein [Solirubrobacterales bacterium]
MSEQTLQARPIEPPVLPKRSQPPRARSTGELIYRYRWVLGALGLLAVSTLVVLWARTRPGYDPYGWLVWGHLTVHFNLDTNGAPSWKPLPYLFTAPYALVGHYALWLWMVTSVAISLSGVVFAWRIAFRLTGAPPARRYAAYAAGLFAALALLGIRDYAHFILSAQSDTMIVSLCLGAIDCHLSGRLRWAFWLWLLAALGRPEAWPFLGLYALWMWREQPSYRRWIGGGLVLIPVFWFGIPALTAKSAFIAGNNALNSPRELHNNKFFGTMDRFLDLHELPVQLAALFAIGLAAWRRQRPALIIAAGAALWVLVEGGFALHGWPAVPRYLFEPVGAMCVLSGLFVGRVILDLPGAIARSCSRLLPQPGRVSTQAGNWGTIVVLAVLAGTMLPPARSRLRIERHDLTHERARAVEINRLSGVVSRLGASRILACGTPNIPIAYQSILAWYMGIKIGILYYNPNSQRLNPHPVVNIYPTARGWKVFPSYLQNATQRARCRGLISRL